MKNIILLISFQLIILSSLKAENDTLNVCRETYNTNILDDNNILDSCQEIRELNSVEKKQFSKPIINKKNKIKRTIKKQKNSQPVGFSDWLDEAWEFLKNLGKPVHGRYTEESFRSEGPYFTFDRSLEGNNYLRIQLDSMREKIKIAFSDEKELYKKILASAGTTTIENCLLPEYLDLTIELWAINHSDNTCTSPARAKASAFVYLVGLNASGDTLSTADRNGYRDRAI
ncbi:MAG: hypothetical protein ACOYMA_07195 [Bacteroidia bacterium]